MSGVNVGGVTKLPTGVYDTFDVSGNVAANIPNFNVPVVIGKQYSGIPFDAVGANPFQYGANPDDTADAFGRGSDIAIGYNEAYRHNATACYFLGLNPATQTVFGVNAGVTELLSLTSKRYGSVSGDDQITVSTASGKTTIAIKSPIEVFYLKDDTVAGAKQFNLRAAPTFNQGDVLIFRADGLAADFTAKVLSIIAHTITGLVNGVQTTVTDYYTVLTDTAFLAGFDVAHVARCWADKSQNYYSETFTASTMAQLASFVNGQSVLWTATAVAEGTPDAIATIRASQITGATIGLTTVGNAVSDASRHLALIAALPQLLSNLSAQLGRDARLFLVLSGDHSVHQAYRGYADTRKSLMKPINIVSGTDYLPVSPLTPTDMTNPALAAADLNDDEFVLAVGGGDGLPAYLSFAAAAFGMRTSLLLASNLTDRRLNYSIPEYVWSKETGEMDTVLQAGCLVYDTEGYLHIEKGQNTLQNQVFWDKTHDQSYLIMQRDLADFHIIRFPIDLNVNLASQTDESLDSVGVAVAGNNVLSSYQRQGYNTGGNVTSVVPDANGEGWDVDIDFTQPHETNYVVAHLHLHV